MPVWRKANQIEGSVRERVLTTPRGRRRADRTAPPRGNSRRNCNGFTRRADDDLNNLQQILTCRFDTMCIVCVSTVGSNLPL